VYFDFAPLAAIPAYQDEPVKSLQNINDNSHFTAKEYETMANKIGASAFAHPDTATEVILKTAKRRAYEEFDEVDVTAYSYTIVPRVDFVPTLGGDGRIHPVPVSWDEYIPLIHTTVMDVTHTDTTETEYGKVRSSGAISDVNPAACYHGLFARIRDGRENGPPNIKKLKSQFDKK
jgi:hypothetical protein